MWQKLKLEKPNIATKVISKPSCHTPNSLKDSNVNPSRKHRKKDELRHAP